MSKKNLFFIHSNTPRHTLSHFLVSRWYLNLNTLSHTSTHTYSQTYSHTYKATHTYKNINVPMYLTHRTILSQHKAAQAHPTHTCTLSLIYQALKQTAHAHAHSHTHLHTLTHNTHTSHSLKRMRANWVNSNCVEHVTINWDTFYDWKIKTEFLSFKVSRAWTSDCRLSCLLNVLPK